MPLTVYNSLTKKKQPFEPLRPDRVGFYVCGPTVYDYFHIGNARPFIMFDVIRRYMLYRGYNVRYVMNLTDIDDKIIERARKSGVESREISQKFAAAFFEDLQKIGVRPADFYPRATDHVSDMIDLIQRLVDRGAAYESGGDVFFNVRSFESYACLSGKKLDELQSGARIGVDDRKQDPLDFVLWKAAKPGEPAWESPWGEGRPGWHLECSTMSMKYLGETFDLHAGGQDLIFPHHENEIAQSEAATGKPFARYWLHNGFLDVQGEKMAKSLGNFVTVREVAKSYSPAVLRLFFLQKHYRGPIDFSEDGLKAAAVSARRIQATMSRLQELGADSAPDQTGDTEFDAQLEEKHSALLAAMDDDFNTPQALSHFFDLLREANRFLDGASGDAAAAVAGKVIERVGAYNSFFGIVDDRAAAADEDATASIVESMLALREQLRRDKAFDVADQIRDRLAEAGVVVEDSPAGAKWRISPR